MKYIAFVAAFVTMLTFSPAYGDDRSSFEAEKLLDTMKMDRALQHSIEVMLNLQLQQNPSLAPYKAVMIEFFQKYMSYQSLKSDLITIYAEAFTASELHDINSFYATPTGQKTIEVIPVLMSKGGQLGAKRVQENISELKQMIKKESERIQDLQKK